MAEEGLQLFGGDWTERKLDALDRYLKAYSTALSKAPFKRVYIDAFAGTGYREQRLASVETTSSIFDDEVAQIASPEQQRFLDGSAKIALRVQPPFHQFVFIEQDAAKVTELEKLKTEFATHANAIDIRTGDANQTLQNLCRSWDKPGSRGVLFLDPFGMQADWSTVQAVAETGCIDTWILFPFAANRLMTRDPNDIPAGWRKRLDKLFGSSEWERQFYRERTITDIFNGDSTVVEKALTLEGLGAFYLERLKCTFPIVAPNPCMLRTSGNRPLFQLFFAAGAKPEKGGNIALKIAKHILDKI
ncbi:MAG: three-Cys-motif partner protein TcmP [Tepidisphaeraceae bacterium]